MFYSQDFCVFVKFTDFKICGVIIDIATQWKLNLFLLNLESSTIKMKFGQILVCSMKSMSSIFLAQCWTLGTSSKPFYDFIKMTV